MEAPYLIEPQSLFGLHTSYTSAYLASEEVHTICINKSDVWGELFKYDIFRLNFLNIISHRAKQQERRLWNPPVGDAPRRILHFIGLHAERTSTRKVVKIKMETLAGLLNESRLVISKALGELRQEGVVETHRGEIILPGVPDELVLPPHLQRVQEADEA